MESPPTEKGTQASPPGAGAAGPWGWLELSYSDRHNGLVAALVSVTQDGAHSLRSVLNWVGGSASDGWYWRADATRNTLIGILNADTEEARVQVSLDYYSGGQKRSYQLPERLLAARSAALVDVAAVLAAGQPDPDGDLIPAGVTTGGYRVQKVGPRLGQVLTTEGLLVDRQRKNFESIYHTCCALTNVKILPSFLEIPFQQSGEITVTAFDLCTFQTVSIAESAEFLSSNPAVADVGGGGGEVFGAGGGTATVHTEVNYFEYTCTPASSDKDTATTVKSVTVSLAPVTVVPGGQTTVTVTVLPAQSGQSVSLSRQEVANSGGHLHLGRPLGTLGATSGTTNAQGKFITTYTASQFGGGEVIKATHNTGSATISGFSPTLNVEVLGLVLLNPHANTTTYRITGHTGGHPENHFGTLGFLSKLSQLAQNYFDLSSNNYRLFFNDMSLPKGGFFDIGPNSTCTTCQFWAAPHGTHRTGTHVDLNSCADINDALIQSVVANLQGATVKDTVAGCNWHTTF